MPALYYNGSAMNVEAIRTGWVGRVIDGRFTLRELLDATETRAVFLTEIPGAQPRKAILKLIEADGDEVDRRLGAWTLAAALSHPHLLRVYHSGRCVVDQIRCVYIVTEYADEVLSEVIPARPLTPDETSEMLTPVVEALEWLHASSFVHGHVKPSNIFVVGEEIKLSADGLAAAGSQRPVSAANSIYDAPESRSAPLAPAADVWSIGVTLVEVLTQHTPEWERSTSAEPFVPTTLPQPFADIARACLRPIPTYRCTLADVKDRLAGEVESAPEPTLPHPIHTEEIEKEAPVRLGAKPLVILLAVVLGIIALLYMQLRSPKGSAPQNPPAAGVSPETQGPAPAPSAAESQKQTSAPGTTAPAAQAPSPQARSAPGAPVSVSQGSGVVQRVLPTVSAAAQTTIHGTVQLAVRVKVDATGQVTDATLATAGPSKYFARLALESSRSWKFAAPQSAGRSVPSTWLLHYRFTSASIEATATRETP